MSPAPGARVLGLLMPLLSGPGHLRILSGVRRAAHEAGCTLAVYYAGLDADVRAGNDLFVEHTTTLAREIDGWVITTAAHSAEWARAMRATGKPLVLISPPATIDGCGSVRPDNLQGLYLATSHLIGLGHTRIAFIGHTPNSDLAARYAGYQQALQEHALTFDPALVCTAITWRREYWSAIAGAEALRAVHERGVPFTALVAATDELAAGAINALRDLGLHVPSDCAVTGFDDAPIALTTDPPLTTIRQSFNELGFSAVGLLREMIDTRPSSDPSVLVPTTLVRRSSCGSEPDWVRPIVARDTAAPLADQIVDVLNVAPTADLQEQIAMLVASHERALHEPTDQAWIRTLQRTLPAIIGERRIEPTRVQQALAVLRNAAADATRAAHLGDMAQRALPVAYAQTATVREFRHAETLDLNNVLLDLFRLDSGTMLSLDWMRETIVERAWLFLRDTPENGALRLAGEYTAVGIEPLPQPAASIVALADPRPERVLNLFGIRVDGLSRGICALQVHERDLTRIINTAGTWIALLEVRLAMDALIGSLRESRDSLETAINLERTLAATVRELGAPVMPVADGVVVLPLIGAIDGSRGEQIIGELLSAVASMAAHTVVIDITGVPVVDTYVAGSLVRAARAVNLLGARVVLTGIRPEVAQTLVQLGVSFSDFETRSTLQDGLRSVLGRVR